MLGLCVRGRRQRHSTQLSTCLVFGSISPTAFLPHNCARLTGSKWIPAPVTGAAVEVTLQGGLVLPCPSRQGGLQPLGSASLPGHKGSSFSS